MIMRNRIPFGYTPFGGVVIVKLNVKLSDIQSQEIMSKYLKILCFPNGKFGRAIEGTILYSQQESFIKDLEVMKLDAKIERLIEQKTKMLDAFVTPNFDSL
jgi:hypothetical protein